MSEKNPVIKLAKEAAEFVAENNAQWDHDGWEAFCAKAAKLGVNTSCDETRAKLGALLESLKDFYQSFAAAACAEEKPKKKACGSRSRKSAAKE
ncbi:MAG TPA: hypothetical protein PLO53_12375 [Candidatus Hydrogenedentes bacterium]|nr:hypothetical protein [Candidatus Hydrogenedentota bacterium]